MTFRTLVRALLRVRRRGFTSVPIAPEFGIRVTLREGDKLVYRDPRGRVVVRTITRGAERGA